MLDVTSILNGIDSQQDRAFSLILEAVRLALRPYPTGEVTLYMGQEKDFMSFDASRTLIIECENFKRIPFAFEIKRSMLDDCCVDKTAWDAADEAYRWFFYRPALSADDHIILGED